MVPQLRSTRSLARGKRSWQKGTLLPPSRKSSRLLPPPTASPKPPASNPYTIQGSKRKTQPPRSRYIKREERQYAQRGATAGQGGISESAATGDDGGLKLKQWYLKFHCVDLLKVIRENGDAYRTILSGTTHRAKRHARVKLALALVRRAPKTRDCFGPDEHIRKTGAPKMREIVVALKKKYHEACRQELEACERGVEDEGIAWAPFGGHAYEEARDLAHSLFSDSAAMNDRSARSSDSSISTAEDFQLDLATPRMLGSATADSHEYPNDKVTKGEGSDAQDVRLPEAQKRYELKWLDNGYSGGRAGAKAKAAMGRFQGDFHRSVSKRPTSTGSESEHEVSNPSRRRRTRVQPHGMQREPHLEDPAAFYFSNLTESAKKRQKLDDARIDALRMESEARALQIEDDRMYEKVEKGLEILKRRSVDPDLKKEVLKRIGLDYMAKFVKDE